MISLTLLNGCLLRVWHDKVIAYHGNYTKGQGSEIYLTDDKTFSFSVKETVEEIDKQFRNFGIVAGD